MGFIHRTIHLFRSQFIHPRTQLGRGTAVYLPARHYFFFSLLREETYFGTSSGTLNDIHMLRVRRLVSLVNSTLRLKTSNSALQRRNSFGATVRLTTLKIIFIIRKERSSNLCRPHLPLSSILK